LDELTGTQRVMCRAELLDVPGSPIRLRIPPRKSGRGSTIKPVAGAEEFTCWSRERRDTAPADPEMR